MLFFKEVREKLEKQHKLKEAIGNQTVNLKLNINLKKVDETKGMKKIVILRQ